MGNLDFQFLGQFVGEDVATELEFELFAGFLLFLGGGLVTQLLLNGLVDDGFRQEDLNLIQQCFDQTVACVQRLLRTLGLLSLLLHVLHEFVSSVEFGCHLGEFVINLRHFTHLHGVNMQSHFSFFAGVVSALELGREGHVVTRVRAAQSLVLAIQHRAGTDFVGNLGHRIHLFTVDRCGQVDGDEVAGLSLALDGLQRGESGAQAVQLGLHVFVGNIRRVNLNGHVIGNFGHFEGGNDVDLAGEDELAADRAAGRRNFGDFDAGLSHGAQFVFHDRLRVQARQNLVDCLLDDGGTTKSLIDNARRNVSLTETGDIRLLRNFLVCLVHLRLDFFMVGLNGQAHLGGLEGLNSALHVCALQRLVSISARISGT